jgi:hypothetical protein
MIFYRPNPPDSIHAFALQIALFYLQNLEYWTDFFAPVARLMDNYWTQAIYINVRSTTLVVD